MYVVEKIVEAPDRVEYPGFPFYTPDALILEDFKNVVPDYCCGTEFETGVDLIRPHLKKVGKLYF